MSSDAVAHVPPPRGVREANACRVGQHGWLLPPARTPCGTVPGELVWVNSPHVWLRLRSAETHDDYNPDDEETIPKSETESEQIRNGLKKNEIFAGGH